MRQMNPAQRIVAYLKDNSSAEIPVTREALSQATGLTRKQVADRLHKQIERGMIGCDADYRVWFIRDRHWRQPVLSKEQKRLNKRKRETELRRQKGSLPRAEYNARRAVERAERLRLRREASAAREMERQLARQRKVAEAAKRAQEAARVRAMAQAVREARVATQAQQKRQKMAQTQHGAQDHRDAFRQVQAIIADALASPAPKPKFPSTEEFIAAHRNDPAKYQILDRGACSPNGLRIELW